jgi:DNA-binding beta-propeller fold protein YncE
MGHLFKVCLPFLACALIVQVTSAAPQGSSNFMIGTDMMKPDLYLINTESDKQIRLDLTKDPKWPGGLPLHTIITADGSKAYLSVVSSDKDPLTILALRINQIDWNAGTADVKIANVMRLEEPGAKPSMLMPTQTDPRQPVTSFWKRTHHELHGPTIHPSGKFVYYTQWTDNKIRAIDVSTDKLAAVDPIQYGTRTRQVHGVFFNPAGDHAIATGYYFDINEVTLYQVDKRSGYLKPDKVIPLTVSEKNKEYAAFSHFVAWLDNRYAITSTQQTGPTSLTPTGFKVVGPSVWLIDAAEGKAVMIIGPAKTPEESGIYKPASDVIVVGKKLYVGEEDSMDAELNDGYVSIWDISNRHTPKFIKRLKPGKELPEDYKMTHELYHTRDGKYVYAQSWGSGHLIKIDASTDEVVKVFSKQEAGWHMPHGNFVPGSLR